MGRRAVVLQSRNSSSRRLAFGSQGCFRCLTRCKRTKTLSRAWSLLAFFGIPCYRIDGRGFLETLQRRQRHSEIRTLLVESALDLVDLCLTLGQFMLNRSLNGREILFPDVRFANRFRPVVVTAKRARDCDRARLLLNHVPFFDLADATSIQLLAHRYHFNDHFNASVSTVTAESDRFWFGQSRTPLGLHHGQL